MKLSDTKVRQTSSDLERKNQGTGRLSILNDDRSEITYLLVSQLYPYQKQARKIFDPAEIEALALTIKEHGVRQPLTVLRVESDPVYFEVISGERRLRAAKLVGLQKVPCIIINSKEQAEEIALIENIQRQDLHPLELGEALKTLLEKIGWGGQSSLEKKLGIPQSKISELLRLSDLPPAVKESIIKTNYRGRDNLRKLVALNNENEQLKLIDSNFEKITQKKAIKNKESSSLSIIRVALQNDKLKIQKSGLSKLNESQRQLVREHLLNVLKEIS